MLNSDRSSNTVRIEGYDKSSQGENITLKDITVCGEKLSSAYKTNSSLEVIKNSYTKNIKIENSNDSLFAKIINFFARLFQNLKNLFSC